MLAHLVFLFSIILLVQGQYYNRAAPPAPRPGECVYTFTVSGAGMQDSCRYHEVQNLVDSLKAQYNTINNENKDLKKQLKAIRDEYSTMVESVKLLQTETASWREIIEWPKIEIPFEPDNASLIIRQEPAYVDCWAARSAGNRKAGIYTLQPEGALVPFWAYCDEEGWTVFQRRFDGKVEFYRNWDDYSKGFGRLSGEFWLGNENIHLLTHQKAYEFRAEVMGWNGKLYHSNYDDFNVLGEMDDYALQVGNMTSGNYKDVMSVLVGYGFTTRDRDMDGWYNSNCAEYYRGGFWLTDCGFDPNRQWCEGGGCMSWGDKVIKKSLLKLRPMSAKGHSDGKRNRAGRRRPHRRPAETVEPVEVETETDDDDDGFWGKK